MTLSAHWTPDWQWFALRVAPNLEWAVQERLRDAGYHVFTPIKHIWVKRRGMKRKALKAVNQYPGYVFIGQEPGQELPWLDITERHEAILGVIGYRGEPAVIQERTMIPMLAGCRRPINYVNSPWRKRGKRKGQNTAEIASGPYQGRTVRVVDVGEGDLEIFQLFQVAA